MPNGASDIVRNSEDSDDENRSPSTKMSPEKEGHQTSNQGSPRDNSGNQGAGGVAHGEFDTEDVEKKMIRNTNIILAISIITLTALIYFKIYI